MIDILMATYNGEKYIGEQIESILKQTCNKWRLYIRDDGSTDSTIEIIEKYAAKYSDKIIIVKDSKKGLGAKLNFGELIKYSTNEYCMFSDQDDVWLENKIEVTLNKMIKSEKIYGPKTPILVHTDLKVVDRELNIIAKSFWEYQNLNCECKEFNYLLVQNNITGCTMMLNKKLTDMSKNIPKQCIMHDWWIGLIASSFGKIENLNKQTILYRQHGDNEVGAHNYASLQFVKNKILKIGEVKHSINRTIFQAKAFYENYKNELSCDKKYLIIKYCNLKKVNIIKRKLFVIKYKFFKQGKIRILGYMIFI